MSVDSRSDFPRALITGLQGFTGRYLCAELQAAGYQVFGTAHTSEELCTNSFKVDLRDRTELDRVVREVNPDVVAHLAAISFVAHGDAEAIYQTNVVGTRNLLEALSGLAVRPRAVLLASSANIYGNAAVEVIDESVVARPANDYAVSKLAMEYMATLWSDKLPIVIARPFNYTGVGQTELFLLSKIVSHYRRRAEKIELGNLDVSRDFCDVRAVAYAYRRLLQACPIGETVNICAGRAYSLRDALHLASSITQHKMRVEVNPAFVRAHEVKTLKGDPSKLRKLIGYWEPPSLEETLRWMLNEGQE